MVEWVSKWIMKGEVYGKRSFSTCWNGQETTKRVEIRGNNFNKGGNQTLVKKVIFKLKKCYSLKKNKIPKGTKGKMKGNSGRGHELSNGMFGIKSVHEDGMFNFSSN
jgi:hypothetical protein